MASRANNPFIRNFLGTAPDWYKLTILGFLLVNPVLYLSGNSYLAGWVLVLEFIFTLAMALKCYPLQPGGLLAIEALFLGMTTPGTVYFEVEHNLEVVLLLIFMVAGIYFLKDMLLFAFTKLLVNVRSKILLSLLFSFVSAVLSAFLDALTVTAVIITVSVGFYSVYHKVASGKHFDHDHDMLDDERVDPLNRDDLESFRSFLRSLMMHAAVGTALGGVCTLVGEPQNILIGTQANWEFGEFFFRMAPVTMPVLAVGLLTCIVLEATRRFGYGQRLSPKIFNILKDYDAHQGQRRSQRDKAAMIVQALVALWLVVGLLGHFAAVGLIGLSVIVLATAFTGIISEHNIGKAFEEALPFTALLVVFFSIVAVINDQQLFKPVTDFVLAQDGGSRVALLYVANGILSAISDNVFVATVYVSEMTTAIREGIITRDEFDLMAVAINTGTNIPSVATPNGQAAFLFLLTSALAPLIRLSYGKMVVMALPYTVTMAITGYFMVSLVLADATEVLYDQHLIEHHNELPGEAVESDGGSGSHH